MVILTRYNSRAQSTVHTPHVSYLTSSVAWLLSYISCLMSPVSVSYSMSPFSRLMSLSHVSCLTSPVSRLLFHLSCLLSPVCSRLLLVFIFKILVTVYNGNFNCWSNVVIAFNSRAVLFCFLRVSCIIIVYIFVKLNKKSKL